MHDHLGEKDCVRSEESPHGRSWRSPRIDRERAREKKGPPGPKQAGCAAKGSRRLGVRRTVWLSGVSRESYPATSRYVNLPPAPRAKISFERVCKGCGSP